MPRAAIVVNPISGSGTRARRLERFRALLEEGGYEAEIRPTRCPNDGANIAREEAERGAEVVVAAGGDGTVNDVATGLLELGDGAPRLGVLPRGTSNLVARELRIPFTAEGAAAVVLGRHEFAMDVGIAAGRVFVACLGIGWDAHVVRLLSERRRGHIGFLSWTRPILEALARYEFHPLVVRDAEGHEVTGIFALVFNTRPYAAFFTPAPDARCDDGLLDVLVVRHGGALDVPRWTFKSLRGTLHHDASVAVLRTTKVHVTSEVPVPWQVDGDVGADTPVDILVRPGAIRMLRPAPAPPPGSRAR